MTNPNRPSARLIAVLMLLIGAAIVALVIQFAGHQRRMSEIPPADPAGPSVPSPSKVVSGSQPDKTIPELLAEVTAAQDPRQLKFMNSVRARMMREALDQESARGGGGSESLQVMLVNELVNAGKTEEAARECRKVIDAFRTMAPEEWKQTGSELLILQSIAYLRMGEEQNCCSRNNADSCLLPVSGRGIHTRPYGSREAIKSLEQALKLDPDSLAARWLLNIGYMTLGQYPSRVPAKWLIPMKSYGGQSPMKPFHNAASEMGLDLLGWAGGVALEDFEGDGNLHHMISSMQPNTQLRYFHNNGNGAFTERTKDAGILGQTGGLNFITTDYDNDGLVDLVILRGGWYGKGGNYPLSLLRNEGKGKFKDVTIEAGLLSYGATQTAVAFDYNGDGHLDLFVGYEYQRDNPIPSKLFRNNGNGTFTDVTDACGIKIDRMVKGVISADFMKNGRPGLYISCVEQPNVLLRNDGPDSAGNWKFTDISKEAGVDEQQASFSCFFFDYDNDSWPDIYVGGYGGVKHVGDVAADYLGKPTSAERARLYRNNGNGTFTDVSKQTGLYKVNLGMGINFGDLDNDGWLDFYTGTGNPDLSMLIPNRMFHNVAGKRFDEVTVSGNFGHLQKGHGISFADLDNDGDQDIYEVMGGAFEGDTARNCLYVNPGSKNRWLTLKLTGVKSNRLAFGAEICVTVSGPHGERSIYKTVGPGGSFGNNPLRQEIGLGDATGIRDVTIRWPATGVVQTVTGLQPNRFYKIQESASSAEPWTLRAFHLPDGSSPGRRIARRP
jgi:hypothetical protein